MLQKREPKEATSRQSSFTKPNSSHKSKGRRVHHKGKVTGFHIHILERQTLNTPQFLFKKKVAEEGPLDTSKPNSLSGIPNKVPKLEEAIKVRSKDTLKITVATNVW